MELFQLFFGGKAIMGILVIAVVSTILFVLKIGYLKAPPDKAYIISGLRNKTIIGQSSIRIPYLERYDILDLSLVPIDVKTKSKVPTLDYININVDGIANVKISTDPELLPIAAQNFLNKDRDYLRQVVQEILEGNMREIVGKMKLQEMVSDRQRFAEEVKGNVIPDLRRMGLELVNFNVQNFYDENGLIEDLGIDNISQIRKKAAIAKAEAEKEIARARAEADKETAKAIADAEKEKAIAKAEADDAANEVRIKTDESIATRETGLSIRKSQLKKDADTEASIASAAGRIQDEVQNKTVMEAEADAQLARQAKEVEIRRKAAEVQEQELTATIRKKAEADKFAALQKADADLYRRKKEAEAARYEEEQRAEAQKIKADAERYAAEQDAAGIRAKGEAEAAAIQARGEAEAQGVLKRAEAQRKMGEASILDMYFHALPEVARAVSEPMANVGNITMYGSDNATKLAADVTGVMSQVMGAIRDATGLDLGTMVNARFNPDAHTQDFNAEADDENVK